MSSDLSRRLAQIERKLPKILEERKLASCTCRGYDKAIYETCYHTVEELERILWVPCPVHGMREPGRIWPTRPDMALQLADRICCQCPPDPLRDWEEGKRTRPAREEIDAHAETECLEYANKPEEVRKKEFRDWSAHYDSVIDTFKVALVAARRAPEQGWDIWQTHSPFAKQRTKLVAPAGPLLSTPGTALCTPTQSAPPSWGARAAEKTCTSSKVRRVHSRRLTASKASNGNRADDRRRTREAARLAHGSWCSTSSEYASPRIGGSGTRTEDFWPRTKD